MIYWYQNLYMDETVEKNPKRCKKRVEKRRPWKKSYVVLTLAQNDKNLFEIMQTRQLFFHRYRHVDSVHNGRVFYVMIMDLKSLQRHYGDCLELVEK